MDSVEKARSIGRGMALDPSLQIILVPGPGAVAVQWRTIARTRMCGVIKGDVKRMELETADERAAFMEGLSDVE